MQDRADSARCGAYPVDSRVVAGIGHRAAATLAGAPCRVASQTADGGRLVFLQPPVLDGQHGAVAVQAPHSLDAVGCVVRGSDGADSQLHAVYQGEEDNGCGAPAPCSPPEPSVFFDRQVPAEHARSFMSAWSAPEIMILDKVLTRYPADWPNHTGVNPTPTSSASHTPAGHPPLHQGLQADGLDALEVADRGHLLPGLSTLRRRRAAGTLHGCAALPPRTPGRLRLLRPPPLGLHSSANCRPCQPYHAGRASGGADALWPRDGAEADSG